MYNFPSLARFAIPRSSLPADAILLHRSQSYFEQHRSAILTGLGVVAILTVIIVLLVLNVAKQRKINSGNCEILKLNREVIESRSQDTANHVRRVAAYSALLGRKYGLSEEDILLLEAASPMHDVGKIGIPDAVLRKPGPLDADEWATMRRHPEIGAEIIGEHPSGVLQLARESALAHHEKWDGSGYPRGLAGEAIPLSARIVAIADVFDALTTRRPYKEPWPVQEAMNHIAAQAGKHFDPALVALFAPLLPQLLEIRARWAE